MNLWLAGTLAIIMFAWKINLIHIDILDIKDILEKGRGEKEND